MGLNQNSWLIGPSELAGHGPVVETHIENAIEVQVLNVVVRSNPEQPDCILCLPGFGAGLLLEKESSFALLEGC